MFIICLITDYTLIVSGMDHFQHFEIIFYLENLECIIIVYHK